MHTNELFRRDRVTILGVLNVTPDSFSDGGRFVRESGAAPDLAAVMAAAAAQVEAGADVLDVGGESTRPVGMTPVSIAEELARTRPVVEALAKTFDVPVSIDTRRAEVAEAALDAGAQIVNDVSGGADGALLRLVARRGALLVLGHLRGEALTMMRGVSFRDIVAEVGDELTASIARAEAAGIARARIVADPGIGFGKRAPHSLALLANVGALRHRIGVPVLVGPSRKTFLGELTAEPDPARRDSATHAACAIAVFAGADGVRVHDVAGARLAARVALALREARA
jgi:dihydropteroate synthase